MNTNTTICVCACVARSGAAFGAPIYITGFSDAVLNFVEQWQGIPSAAIRDNPVYDTGPRLLVDATQAQDYPAYIAEVVGLPPPKGAEIDGAIRHTFGDHVVVITGRTPDLLIIAAEWWTVGSDISADAVIDYADRVVVRGSDRSTAVFGRWSSR